ncbi:exo-alpha-sialidase [Methylomonas sp. MgM2]
MFDFNLRNIRKGLCLLITVNLLACSESSVKDHVLRPAELVRLKSIDVPALAGNDLISFDIYPEQGILHAVFAAATATPKQPYVAYIKSEDGGRHWSKPVSLGQYASNTLESGTGNDIQIAAHENNLLVIWQATGEIPGMGPLQLIYSKDGGAHWQSGANPTGPETDQSHPDLAGDAQGRFHLVWLDDRDENGYQGVRYARTSNAGLSWELAQTIDDSSCSCCWNRLLIGPDQQVDVLYRDMEPRDMALAQTEDAGQNWQRISTVGEFNWVFDGCPHNGGAIAWAGDTLQTLVWTGEESKAGLYHLSSSDNGKSWSPPQSMGGGSLAFHSDIAASGNERLLAIWDARGAAGSTVMISESFDKGLHWSPARQISTPGGSAQFPRLVSTPSGFLAMWLEQKTGAAKQWMSAIIQ